MGTGKSVASIGVHHRCAQGFGQVEHRRQRFGIARQLAGDDYRPLRLGEKTRGGFQRLRISAWPRRRPKQLRMRHHHRLVDLGFLDVAVETDIDRPFRFGHGEAVGFQKRLGDAVHRARLIVELDVIAHRQTLHQRRVHPVGGAPLRGILRPAAAEIQDRRAVAPGVEDRHAGMLQADDVVQTGRHDFAGGPRITIGDRHGDLFMGAHDHLWALFRLEIDHGIMEAAIARPRIERDVLDAQLAQHFDHQIRTILSITLPADARRPNFSATFRCLCHSSSVVMSKFRRIL